MASTSVLLHTHPPVSGCFSASRPRRTSGSLWHYSTLVDIHLQVLTNGYFFSGGFLQSKRSAFGLYYPWMAIQKRRVAGEYRMGCGQRLRQIRQQAGLTQKQLEKISGVPQNTISRIELETVKAPSTKTLLGLSRALAVSMESLLGMDEPQRPSKTAAKAGHVPKTRPRRMERDEHGKAEGN